jgi:hypothetical protein
MGIYENYIVNILKSEGLNVSSCKARRTQDRNLFLQRLFNKVLETCPLARIELKDYQIEKEQGIFH